MYLKEDDYCNYYNLNVNNFIIIDCKGLKLNMVNKNEYV